MNERPTRRQVARSFGRAAQSYDGGAEVQRAFARHLASLKAEHSAPLAGGPLLDAGCGTGASLGALRAAHPGRTVLALDLAEPMLRQCRSQRGWRDCVVADLHALPLRGGAFAAVWSSLSLQWCEPATALAELARVLCPGGQAWLSTLGPDTFGELRSAFAQVDRAEHVLACEAPQRWQAAAEQAGFRVRLVERRAFHARAADLRSLLRGVKTVGAQVLGPGRRRAMLGRQGWASVVAHYEAYRDRDGLLPATYDGVFLILHKPT